MFLPDIFSILLSCYIIKCHFVNKKVNILGINMVKILHVHVKVKKNIVKLMINVLNGLDIIQELV